MTNTVSIDQKERTAQLFWTAFILMFFVIQAVIWAIAISITAADPSHTVLAGYDEQALKWDQVKSAQLASEKLGWSCQIEPGNRPDMKGWRTISLKLADRDGRPIEQANITTRAYHRGRAAEVQQLVFEESKPGTYVGRIQVRNSGRWRFEGAATRGTQQFLIDDEQQIEAKGS